MLMAYASVAAFFLVAIGFIFFIGLKTAYQDMSEFVRDFVR